MSRAAKKSDVERTAILLDLIHRRYIPDVSHERSEPSVRYVVMEEVAPSTGGFNRIADVLVLSCWRSDGLTLDGYEIKSSRADLKKELADPSKSQPIKRYCDSWTLVAWPGIIEGITLPADWGVLVADDPDGDFCFQLDKIRKPTKLTPEPWPRGFVASLVRNAYQQSPGADYLARACRASWEEGEKNGSTLAEIRADRDLDPLRRHLYGKDYRWPERSIETVVADAIKLFPSHDLRSVLSGDRL